MCGTLSGSFIFTRTKTLPFEPFETLVMTCELLKIVLERKVKRYQNIFQPKPFETSESHKCTFEQIDLIYI